MKTLNVIACFAAIAINFAHCAPSAQAQTPGQRQQNFDGGDRFFPALNRVLTDGQRQSFRVALEAQADKIRPLEEKMRASRKVLLDEIAGGNFDGAAARQSAEASASAEADLTLIFAKALSQMQPRLSAPQLEQMKNFQPGQGQPQPQSPPQTEVEPRPIMALPPVLPRDTNDLPVVAPQK
jgi:Spy/CpxP family protein refolding chaperone